MCAGQYCFCQSFGVADTNINRDIFLMPLDFGKAITLKVDKYRNGEKITRANTLQDWYTKSDSIGKYYLDLTDSTYYYNWYAVHDKGGLAPYGYSVVQFDQLPKYNVNFGSGKILIDVVSSSLVKSDTCFWVYNPESEKYTDEDRKRKFKKIYDRGDYVNYNPLKFEYEKKTTDADHTGLNVVCVENISERLNQFTYDVLLPHAFVALKDSLSSKVFAMGNFIGRSKRWTASFEATLRFSNTGLNESSSVVRRECSTADFDDMKSLQRIFGDLISTWSVYPQYNSNPVETKVDLNFIVGVDQNNKQNRNNFRFASDGLKNRNQLTDELQYFEFWHDNIFDVSTIYVRLDKAYTNNVLGHCKASDIYHEVRENQTFGSISRQYGVSINEIKKLNGFSVETAAKGQKLLVKKSDQISYLSSISYPSGKNAVFSLVPGLGSLITDESDKRNKWRIYVGTGLLAGALATVSYMKRNDYYEQYRGSDFTDESLYDKANMFNKIFISTSGLYLGMSVYDLINTLRLGRRNRKHYEPLQERIKSSSNRIILTRIQ
jgi:LysM repeat protein